MNSDILFLSNLNKELKIIEQQIIDRVIVCLNTGENYLKNEAHFTIDYEVEATVAYYVESEDNPIYTYVGTFDYKGVLLNNDYGLLLSWINGDDWREGIMPELDEPYCYLLHDLLDHSCLQATQQVFSITRIWVDIVFTNQKGMKINVDGTSNLLVLNEKEKHFE